MAEKKLFLLDGHALVYRAHYAFINRPLVNSKGMNVSAVTGFTRLLWDLIRNQKPTHLAVAFDPHGGTFRNEMFTEYKANREEQPEDISIALPYIQKIIEAFKIPIPIVQNFEADDVIGTLAKQAEKEGFTVYMMTSDKDYAQLVSENIYLYKPGRKGGEVEVMGVPEVLAKWKIEKVEQVIDVLGLAGDSVDNIPGIPGIGPKTAQTLLGKFGSIENLVANTDQLKGKQKERVIEFGEQGLLSKKLATIDLAVPIQFDAEAYELSEDFDKDTLAEIFKELEFRSLAKSILGTKDEPKAPVGGQQSLFGEPVAAAPKARGSSLSAHSIADKNIENTAHTYELTDTPEKRAALIELLGKQKTFCFDTETTGVDANQAELVGMSFSIEAHKAYYVPVPADASEAQAIVDEFKPLFEDASIEKIGQNIKYDALLLRWYNVDVKGAYFDTMVAHYLIEPELRHNMDFLAESYLKYKPVSIETLIGKRGKNQLTMRDVPVEKAAVYAAEDADVTFQLRNLLQPKLKEEGLQKLYDEIEAPLIKAIVEMEYNGINVDVDYLAAYSKELESGIKEAEETIYDTAGVRFNIASPKQVGEVLFDKMKIPYRWRKTKTGQYSTNEEKLNDLSKDHPVVSQILRFRGLAKLRSTYVDALPRMINPRTGRIHSSFNQALTATGRLSSHDPNLQNIPIRTPEGAKVREAFIAKDSDHILLAADYSQIELRLIAEISGDEAMLEAFQLGQDIHQATAAKVFGVPFEEVSREQRYRAKTVNFSIVYGAGATNLSRQLDIKRTEASELISQYFKEYQGLKTYMDKTVETARKEGFVKTLMGRRRYLRDIDSRNAVIRGHAERNAINTPIQGSAADMIKIAMVNVHRALQKGNFQSKMILQVHDELVFDVYKPELEKIKPVIEENMKNTIPNLKVPILVGMDVGQNWLEAH
ncbi:MAG: DNA polymerase I [Bacteroidota bacterium]